MARGAVKGNKNAWKGGYQNKGSLAWAGVILSSSRQKAKERGHAALSLTAQEVVEIFQGHDKRCDICSSPLFVSPRDFAIDHCHISGRYRGIVCGSCNLVLGKVGDSASLLRSMAEYLEGSK